MKKLLKLVFMFLPFMVLAVALSINSNTDSGINSRIQDANGLIMGTSDKRFVVHNSSSVENEVTTDVIVVTDSDGKVVQDISISMDHDLFGLGFVKAMQADEDPELEVVAWGNNIRDGKPFFLDFSGGEIVRRPIEEISSAAQNVIDNYRNAGSQSYGIFFYFIILTPLYYILYVFVRAMITAPVKKESEQEEQD